jgi:hypothetical protein
MPTSLSKSMLGNLNRKEGFITADKHARQKTVFLLSNDTLARKLPPICCLSTQTLEESSKMFFPCNSFDVCVTDKDIFPALRFFAMLKQHNIIVKGSSVKLLTMHLWSFPSCGLDQQAKYARLITFHWLHNLPLWNCVSEVSSGKGAKASVLFGRCMYSVRQIVALFHKDFARWRLLLGRYLTRCHLVDCITDPSLPSMLMSEIVERVIGILSRAMYRHFYRHAEYDDGDPESGLVVGNHTTWAQHGKPEEFVTLHFVEQYRTEFDAALRQVFGMRYEE